MVDMIVPIVLSFLYLTRMMFLCAGNVLPCGAPFKSSLPCNPFVIVTFRSTLREKGLFRVITSNSFFIAAETDDGKHIPKERAPQLYQRWHQ